MLRWPERGGDEAAVAGRGSARGGGSGRSREEVGAMAGAAGPGNARQPELGRPTMARGGWRPEQVEVGRSGAGAATVVAGRASPGRIERRARRRRCVRLLDLGAVPCVNCSKSSFSTGCYYQPVLKGL